MLHFVHVAANDRLVSNFSVISDEISEDMNPVGVEL